jgi:hypothetical protein
VTSRASPRPNSRASTAPPARWDETFPSNARHGNGGPSQAATTFTGYLRCRRSSANPPGSISAPAPVDPEPFRRLSGKQPEAPERNEPIRVELDSFRLESSALKLGMLRVRDVDLATPRVLLADDTVPGKRFRTVSHCSGHDAVPGRYAGERRDFTVRRHASPRDGAHGSVDLAFATPTLSALRRPRVRSFRPHCARQ